MRMKEGLILYGPPSLLSGLSDEQGRREAMARTMICLHKGVRVPDVPYLTFGFQRRIPLSSPLQDPIIDLLV
jgi:hypothetical protein